MLVTTSSNQMLSSTDGLTDTLGTIRIVRSVMSVMSHVILMCDPHVILLDLRNNIIASSVSAEAGGGH